jgi:hypothetical protein
MDTARQTPAPLPGVAQITYPDGTSEYRYTDELQAAIERAEAAGYAPVVQPAAQPITIQLVTPQTSPAVPVERRQLIEPWMVRFGAGLGGAAGVIALAGPAEAAVVELSVSVGHMLHMAMELGGAGLVAYVLIRLLAGRKPSSGGRVLEVTQIIEQTITQVTRIGE